MKPENCYPQELKMILSEDNWLEKGKETYIFPVSAHVAYEIQITLYHKHSDKMEAAAREKFLKDLETAKDPVDYEALDKIINKNSEK